MRRGPAVPLSRAIRDATVQALSFASPKAVLTALFPRAEPAGGAADTSAARVAAYKRYITSLEMRGAEQIPEFPSGAQWLNAPPLRLSRELQGRVVLLDFWTFCCINCMHILPDLAALERKYADLPVTVVGVHSAKFDNEKDSNAIRSAVLRCAASDRWRAHIPPPRCCSVRAGGLHQAGMLSLTRCFKPSRYRGQGVAMGTQHCLAQDAPGDSGGPRSGGSGTPWPVRTQGGKHIGPAHRHSCDADALAGRVESRPHVQV